MRVRVHLRPVADVHTVQVMHMPYQFMLVLHMQNLILEYCADPTRAHLQVQVRSSPADASHKDASQALQRRLRLGPACGHTRSKSATAAAPGASPQAYQVKQLLAGSGQSDADDRRPAKQRSLRLGPVSSHTRSGRIWLHQAMVMLMTACLPSVSLSCSVQPGQ